MRKPLAIDTGDTIADVEIFPPQDEKYIAVLYKHLDKPSLYGAIFGLIDRNAAEKLAKEQGVAAELKLPVEGDVVTGKKEFDAETPPYIVVEYKRGEDKYAVVFKTFKKDMKGIARQYLKKFFVKISTDENVIVTHTAVQILIEKNRKEDREPFSFNGENYIAVLYKPPVKHGEIHYACNDAEVPGMIALAEKVFESLGEQPPERPYDSYEFVRKLIEVLRKHKQK